MQDYAIDFNHSFKDYNEILNFYGIWDYECRIPPAMRKCTLCADMPHMKGNWSCGILKNACPGKDGWRSCVWNAPPAARSMPSWPWTWYPFFPIPSTPSSALLPCAWGLTGPSAYREGNRRLLPASLPFPADLPWIRAQPDAFPASPAVPPLAQYRPLSTYLIPRQGYNLLPRNGLRLPIYAYSGHRIQMSIGRVGFK